MLGGVLQLHHPLPYSPFLSFPSSTQSLLGLSSSNYYHFNFFPASANSFRVSPLRFHRRSRPSGLVFVEKEDTQVQLSITPDEDLPEQEPTPQDIEYVTQIKGVLELLKKNRDMQFGEVKLTIMIEDPRDVERRRLLGDEDFDTPTRDDLASALEEINEGKVPKNPVALQMLAEEMLRWPNLEAVSEKKGRGKSLYAKATNTGVDPKVAAKRLNVEWDSAADYETPDATTESQVPSVLGYGILYLVTGIPIIIGVSVVLILYYSSFQ